MVDTYNTTDTIDSISDVSTSMAFMTAVFAGLPADASRHDHGCADKFTDENKGIIVNIAKYLEILFV